jgi:hypothetical protein
MRMHIMVVSDLDFDGFCQRDFTIAPFGPQLVASPGLGEASPQQSALSVFRSSRPVSWKDNDLIVGRERFALVGQTPDGDYLAELVQQ